MPISTIVRTLDPVTLNQAVLTEAVEILRAGGLVAFPTETVYGLGANALDAFAVARIFEAKGRPANNPLIVHVADRAAARMLVVDWPAMAERLAERFWPGPLTLVLPRNDLIPDVVTASGPTVALRVPAHPVAQALLRAAAIPLAAPSANRSTELSPTCAEHVLRGLDGRIDMLLDGGPTTGGIESTVLDATTTPPRLLRPGLLDVTALEAIAGPIRRVPETNDPSHAPLPSPGMLPRHYAPRTPLTCIDSTDMASLTPWIDAQQRIGWVTFADPGAIPSSIVLRVLPGNPAGYAAWLYAVLHELDAYGLDRLLVSMPPDSDAWLAIRDRLRRAATE